MARAFSSPALAASALLLSTLACGKAKPPAKEETAPPMVVLYGVRVQSFKGEALAAAARAARVSFQRQGGQYDATEVLARFPQKGGESAVGATVSGIEVRAPEVRGDMATRLIDGRGGVRLRTASGLTGETAAARFDGLAMVSTGKDPVKLFGPGYSMDAVGFEFRFDEERFTFGGEVVSRMSGTGDAP